jgi:uncharacterized damage-inducible protein DinB
MPSRPVRTLLPDAEAPEVGRWLSAMTQARADTLDELADVSDDMLHLRPTGSGNTIGSLLYHLALIEADWFVDEILGLPADDPTLASWFPHSDRDDAGVLIDVQGQSLVDHLRRLAAVRDALLAALRPMSVEDFHTPRARERYDVSPAWVLHHLLQHEGEHRSEIARIRQLLVDRV